MRRLIPGCIVALALLAGGTARADDKEARERASELSRLVLSPDTYNGLFDNIVKAMATHPSSELQSEPPSFWKRVRATMQAVLPYEEMTGDQIALFVKYYTAEELQQLVTFYRTPIGQKSIHVMPVVMGEAMGLVQTRIRERLPAAIDKLEAEEKAEQAKDAEPKKQP